MIKAFSAEELGSWVAEARERWSVPGIAVGVYRGGETVTAADGVLKLGEEAQVTPETVFRVASITKPFVGTLAMTLVQDGLLSLDEAPPGTATDATVRQLLSHQAGLAAEWPSKLDEDTDDEALLRLAEREPARLPVGRGELFSYCNTGYWLVGAAIARRSGLSFEEAMRRRVLEPLGLAATSFEPPGPTAHGHEQVEPESDEHEPVAPSYPRVRRPSGGLWSNVGDLLRFAAHHLGGPGPLTRESIAELQRPLVPVPGGSYALCWFVLDRERPTVAHTGSAAGFQSLLLLAPQDGLALAALTNSGRGVQAIEAVLGRIGLGMKRRPTAEIAPEALSRFAGRYEGQGMTVDVRATNGALELRFVEVDPFRRIETAHPPVSARPVGEREFELVDGDWQGERVDFPRDGFIRTYTLAQRVE